MHSVGEGAKRLANGGVVAFPTETVYGLGADATNVHAVAKIFLIKGRPADHPLIVHVADADGLERWGAGVPESARKLAGAFWPGPLTLIVQKAAALPDMAPDGYRRMLCVEAAAIGSPIELAAGAQWTGAQQIVAR